MRTIQDWDVRPDLNVLLTAGFREDLAQLEATHLLWEIQEIAVTAGDRQLVLVE